MLVIGLGLFLGLAQPVAAIEFHANNKLTFDNDATLNNAYLAGQEVTVSVPVTNDLVVAGSEVTIDSAIDGGLIAAAGQLRLNGSVGQSARIAGGDVNVNGNIGQDLVVLGSQVVIDSDAVIAGDLAFAGGSLIINGDVDGTVLVNCQCNVTINGSVAEVEAEQVGTLTVGQQAVIDGDIQYSSQQEAAIDRDAAVHGAIDYSPLTSTQSAADSLRNFSFFYGMISSLIFTLILLWLVRAVPDATIIATRQNVLLTFGLGIAMLVLLPIVAVTSLLVSVWLGISLLVLYALALLLSFGLAQIIIGWWLLQWWLGRTKQVYELDWRATVVGVIVTTILMFVQVLGWFIIFLAILLALGGLAQGLWRLRQPLAQSD